MINPVLSGLLNTTLIIIVFASGLIGCATSAAPTSSLQPENRAMENGFAAGEKVARELISLGQIELQFQRSAIAGITDIFGTTPNLAEHLRAVHGIACRESSSPSANDYERGYAEGFNRVMIARLEQKHGQGFITKIEEEAASILGRADAARELAKGRLALETYGLPPVSRRAYMDLLNQRHRIQLRAVAGCIVNSSITGHARGFNEVMMAEIEKRFGPDALPQAQADAEVMMTGDQP